MIDFLIVVNKLSLFDDLKFIKINEKYTEISDNFQLDKNVIYFFDNTKYQVIRIKDKTFVFIGDVICENFNNNSLTEIASNFSESKLRNIKGLFYLIVIEKSKIFLYNSLFSILPIFYSFMSNKVLLTSKISFINLLMKNLTIDKKYMVEKLIFNYGFLNNTIYKEIKLVPSNSFISVGENGFTINKHTDIRNFFVENSVTGKSTISFLADLFMETTKNYFPSEKASIAFTGGFDGRTIVSIAKSSFIDFETFSFGIQGNDDLDIPLEQSKRLGLNFTPFFLNDKDYSDSFINDGGDLIDLSSNQSSFLYTHFLYSSRKLSSKTKYILTGYFGSELNRSLNVAGAVTSKKLIDLFIYDDIYWKERILLSPRLDFLNKTLFNIEINEMIEEVLDYKNSLDYNLTLNQKFYTYIFEETFRKIFGAIITAQMKYQFVRTPFLDFEFIVELLKTKFAGVNNPFITNNPLKRLKGQRLYAEIIKRSTPEILELTTGKGYKPKDLLSLKGNLTIVYPFVTKRLKRVIKKTNLDNLQLLSNIYFNRSYFNKKLDQTEFFNNDLIKYKLSDFPSITNEVERDMLIFCLSLNEKKYG